MEHQIVKMQQKFLNNNQMKVVVMKVKKLKMYMILDNQMKIFDEKKVKVEL